MAVANSNAWTAKGISHVAWGLNTGGVPYGATGAISAGSDASMSRLIGMESIAVQEPDSPRLYVLGDDGVVTSFLQRPQELPGGSMVSTVFDQNFYNAARGSTNTVIGDTDFTAFLTACDNFQSIGFIINSQAQAMETANFGQPGYQVIIVKNALVQAKALNQITSAQGQKNTNVITVNPAGTAMWGSTLTSTIGGYIGLSPKPMWGHTFIGNNSATTVTLTYTPSAASATAVHVWVNGTKQTYSTHYSVNTSTKVVTFVTAPANNAIVFILYQFNPDC